ncbi:MAG: hypothetical protein KGO82_17170 [Bacteroidota bacterium]|nr:hypothetical protein [Bacteroidota bacterium]
MQQVEPYKPTQIPLSFEWNGKTFVGHLAPLSGAAEAAAWHLYDTGNFYRGMLHQVEGRWVFHPGPNKINAGMERMAEYFGQVVIA